MWNNALGKGINFKHTNLKGMGRINFGMMTISSRKYIHTFVHASIQNICVCLPGSWEQ